MINFLQSVNIGECHAAHDLMLLTAVQIKVNVLIVSEPNRILAQKHDDLYTDASERSSIVVLRNTAIDAIGPPENGYRWLEIGGTRIYSCYWSPNLPRPTFVDFLARLEASVPLAPIYWNAGSSSLYLMEGRVALTFGVEFCRARCSGQTCGISYTTDC